MLMGSFFAGLAFSNTRTTACHSISYPLTMMYGINHGFAAAITLFEVLKRNWEFVKEKELFLDSFKANDLDDIKQWFDNISLNKLSLSNFGVKKEDIPLIVKEATTGGRMDNNPIVFDESEIQDILLNVFWFRYLTTKNGYGQKTDETFDNSKSIYEASREIVTFEELNNYMVKDGNCKLIMVG